MKAFKYLVASFLLVMLGACTETEGVVFDGNLVGLNLARTNYLFEAAGNNDKPIIGIEVQLIAQQRESPTNVSFEVLPTSTAVAGTHYEIQGSSTVIEAGASSAVLPIAVIPDNFDGGQTVTLDVRVTGGDDLMPSDFSGEGSFNITVVCANTIPLNATWSVTIIEGAFGASGFRDDVTITDGGDGTLLISDITAGVLPALGCCDPDEAVFITNVCDVITIDRPGSTASFDYQTNAAEGYGPGSWDSDNQILTLPWWEPSNGFGTLVVLTPN